MTEPSPPPGRSAAAQYWDANADPQNLERAKGGAPFISLGDEIRFARTPDFIVARDWLAGSGMQVNHHVMDLGAGLGANAIAFAQDGFKMIAVDTSLARLRQLGRRTAEAGTPKGRVVAVVAAAEALPFAANSLGGVFTKSVLIHTEIPRSASELHRILAPASRAALVEPQPANPFAYLYRRLLAPKAWSSITRYFDPDAQRIFQQRFGGGDIAPFFLFSFLAFIFQFAFPQPTIFRLALAPLHLLDRFLFAIIPPFKRLAWFGVIRLEKSGKASPDS